MKKPNIVLIVCHDIGQHLNCYGIKTVSTPSIDQIANEGIRFENSFCTSPSCSPSRASIFTGRYPHNNGVMGLTHAYFAWDFNPGEKHLCVLLKDAGYKTALIGMQHEARNAKSLKFDYLDELHEPEKNLAMTCEDTAERSCKYLEKAVKEEKPFYLQIGFYEPHRKFDFGGAKPDDSNGVYVPAYLQNEPSAQKEFAEYQGIIKKVDASIGKILKKIDKCKISDNTILIFTADHGIPFPRAKCSLYEPGLQVPFIIKWPQRNWIGGKVKSEMISNIDYVPTILDAIGADIPKNIQGKSFCSLLDGKNYQPNNEIFAEMTYHDYYDPRRSLRTDKYKLIANFSTAFFFMNPSQTYRPATITVDPKEPTWIFHPNLELYDLNNDPLETVNLIQNSQYSEIKKELCIKLLNWMKQTNDPLLLGAVTPPHHTITLNLLGA
ncbi:MAG: sulfatase [Phycisphaerales bacterium]